MKKKVLTTAFLLALATMSPQGASATYTEQDIQKILQKLERLENKVEAQEKYIDELRSKLAEKEKGAVPEKGKDADKEEGKKEGPGITLGKAIDNLELKGDLRVRYDRRDRDQPDGVADDARDRFRSRFRVGGIWKNDSENWEVGAGLAIGSADANSSNDTWSETTFFETDHLRLDYAYAKHAMGDLSLTLGQQKNPFESSWLLWDSDVRPAGFTAQYGLNGFFGTLGAYDVYQAGNDVSFMLGGQVGYKGKYDPLKYQISASYYGYDSKIFDLIKRPNPDYDYRIGDIYGKLSFPSGMVTLSPYGQIFQNFGANGPMGKGLLGGNLDPESEDLGWVLGINGNINAFELGYCYAQVGADSVIPQLKDGDFGTGLSINGVEGLDAEGHVIKAIYNFSPNFSFGGAAYLFEAMETPDQEEIDYYQLDFIYKF